VLTQIDWETGVVDTAVGLAAEARRLAETWRSLFSGLRRSAKAVCVMMQCRRETARLGKLLDGQRHMLRLVA